jgi:ubiquinol-cytochrome c reductase cytochrome c1 subunit
MKKMMKKTGVLLLLLFPSFVMGGGGGGVHLDTAPVDLSDNESLKNGAKLFMNYCLSCHSARFMRYKRMADDLGMSDQEVLDNLVFTGAKIHDTMEIAMPAEQAAKWFGTTPPDLSVISRARGDDWLYTYLRGFYVDPSRPMGVNNVVFKDVGMPHVLQGLQGKQTLQEDGTLTVDGSGSMTAAEYDKAVGDLVNFLAYVGEPVKAYRMTLGWYVLGFLLILLIPAYRLKKEYWKDVH